MMNSKLGMVSMDQEQLQDATEHMLNTFFDVFPDAPINCGDDVFIKRGGLHFLYLECGDKRKLILLDMLRAGRLHVQVGMFKQFVAGGKYVI